MLVRRPRIRKNTQSRSHGCLTPTSMDPQKQACAPPSDMRLRVRRRMQSGLGLKLPAMRHQVQRRTLPCIPQDPRHRATCPHSARYVHSRYGSAGGACGVWVCRKDYCAFDSSLDGLLLIAANLSNFAISGWRLEMRGWMMWLACFGSGRVIGRVRE